MKKNLILVFGILLLIAAAFGLYNIIQVLLSHGVNGVLSVEGILFVVVEIVIGGWAGIYLLKNKERIYQKLNVPAGPALKKPLSPWIIVYAIIVLGIIVAAEFMK